MTGAPLAVGLGSLLLGSACSEGATCPAWSFPAVSARVRSDADGAPLLGALGEVREGTYRDGLQSFGDGQYVAAYDRGGTYAVHIEAPGFISWDTVGINVEETGGACSTVTTEDISARLSPAP
jgi:hypothetical protein